MCGEVFYRAGSVATDEEDPIMTIPADLEAQILRYYHVEKVAHRNDRQAVARAF